MKKLLLSLLLIGCGQADKTETPVVTSTPVTAKSSTSTKDSPNYRITSVVIASAGIEVAAKLEGECAYSLDKISESTYRATSSGKCTMTFNEAIIQTDCSKPDIDQYVIVDNEVLSAKSIQKGCFSLTNTENSESKVIKQMIFITANQIKEITTTDDLSTLTITYSK